MILILGEQPGHGYTGPPLQGGISGGRIRRLTGREHGDGYVCENLCPTGWVDTVARRAWFAALRRDEFTALILLGRKAACVAGLRNAPTLTWHEVGAARVGLVPHPSGLNRWWNSPTNTAEAAMFLRKELLIDGELNWFTGGEIFEALAR